MTVYNLRTGIEVAEITATVSPNPIPEIPQNLGVTIALVTASSTDHRVSLPADADIGALVEIVSVTGDLVIVYPPSGESIDALETDQTINIGDNRLHYFRKISASNWRALAEGSF
jgi:hypothetical protein